MPREFAQNPPIDTEALTVKLLVKAQLNVCEVDEDSKDKDIVPLLGGIIKTSDPESTIFPDKKAYERIHSYRQELMRYGVLSLNETTVFDVAFAYAAMAERTQYVTPIPVVLYRGGLKSPAIRLIKTLVGIDEDNKTDVSYKKTPEKFKGMPKLDIFKETYANPDTGIVIVQTVMCPPEETQLRNMLSFRASLPRTNALLALT